MGYSDEELVEIASSKTNPASELAHDLLEFRRGERRVAQTTSHPTAVAKGTNPDAAARLAAELRNVVLPIQKAAEYLGLRLTHGGWSASEWAAELHRRRGADPEEEWENCIMSGIEHLLELAQALADVAHGLPSLVGSPSEDAASGFVPFATASEEDDTLDQLWGVDDATKGQLSWRVVANAAFRGPPALRWVHVSAATGYGRSVASAMCRAEGFDPDEIVGTPDGKRVPNAHRVLKRENDELRRSVVDLRKEIAWLRESPTPSAGVPAEATVPAGVHERGWQWRPTGEDTAFAPPFGTIRVCRHCGCLVAGGPNACARCDAALHEPPVQGIDRT